MNQQTAKKKAHYFHLKIEQKNKAFSHSMFNDRGYRMMGI